MKTVNIKGLDISVLSLGTVQLGLSYGINNADMLKGLLSGLHAGNFDITHVYIDNLYKTIGNDRATGEAFVEWCAEFAKVNSMEITVTISDDPALASETVKQYM